MMEFDIWCYDGCFMYIIYDVYAYESLRPNMLMYKEVAFGYYIYGSFDCFVSTILYLSLTYS